MWHTFPPLSWWLRCAFWAATCGLKTWVEIMAHSHKLLMLAYIDGVLSSTQILLPESPKTKINYRYTITHITTTPQREIKEQFL